MTKTIKIDKCCECPYHVIYLQHGEKVSKCAKSCINVRTLDNMEQIPSWCELDEN